MTLFPESSVTIRVANLTDADSITAVFVASRDEAMPYLPVLYTPAEIQYWISEIVLKKQKVFVATRKNVVVGFLAISPGVVDHLYVAPEEQGRGSGTILLEMAKEHFPDGLRLNVFQRNFSARRFYDRKGFKLVELRDGSQNEESEPDAVYAWRNEVAAA